MWIFILSNIVQKDGISHLKVVNFILARELYHQQFASSFRFDIRSEQAYGPHETEILWLLLLKEFYDSIHEVTLVYFEMRQSNMHSIANQKLRTEFENLFPDIKSVKLIMQCSLGHVILMWIKRTKAYGM